MDTKEDVNGTVKQMEDFASDQPTGDRAGLLGAGEGVANGGSHGDNSKPKSPDKTSASSVESGSEVSPLHMDQETEKMGAFQAEGLKVIVVSCIVFSLSVTVALIVTIYYGPSQVSPHGAVASPSQQCSEVGTDMLKDSGSAIDAAIATVMCEGVVSSHLTGIGGGGFLIYRDHKHERSLTVDFRETAPGSSSADMYDESPGDKKRGPKSVAVPGQLKGLAAAHKKYGKKPWKDLLAPAISLARNGFIVTEYLAESIESKLMENGHMTDTDNKNFTDMYFINGEPAKAGETLKFPELANTLEKIANNGPEEFYSGSTAEEIAKNMKEKDGYITLDDLKGYTVTYPGTIQSSFKGSTIQTLPAPAGGASVLTILNVLDLYGVGLDNRTDNLTYHRMIEAMKFAEALHDELGDPAFVPSVTNFTHYMVSREAALQIKSKINDSRTYDSDYYGSVGTSFDQGTSHVSVIGPHEEFVSVTTSINYLFGSHFVTSNGILLNNLMDDFSVADGEGGQEPNENNYIEPNKRPVSNMSPVLVYSKSKACAIRMAVGGTNGNNITLGVAEVILNTLGFGESLFKAVNSSRISPNRLTKIVRYEDGVNEELIKFLGEREHTMLRSDKALSDVHVVAKINETITAQSDTRTHGSKASIF